MGDLLVYSYPIQTTVAGSCKFKLTMCPTEGGDSGAWVIDNATGRVCGHVLAYSSKSNAAYIAPMEVLLKDMAKTLSAEINLPVPHTSPVASDHTGNGSAPEKVNETVSVQLRDDGKVQDTVVEIARQTLEPPSSPPLPTSPPLLTPELSRVNLKEITNPNFPLDRKPPDCVGAAATCRSKDRITNELAESVGRVRAKC